MEAILRLKRAGLSRTQIAAALEVTPQLVGMYERGKRFPSADNFARLVELGNAKGLNLLAGDFVSSANEGGTDARAVNASDSSS